ncbi:LytTR family transcriptional regulator DNA-binding domain-containing protein [Erysipelothrix urinaevulpis]|uniref:LytTR family transcriptional regulator DNA-binding domain-containing protein n=1 Tax=Erysipelothrix urinaevulpis TaxID=2683717 RepID=UPI00135C469D|nr:LytTR family transcriptional regulator DNA-binding domain-containing protein [Erysipelothrix urinaevulpis]
MHQIEYLKKLISEKKVAVNLECSGEAFHQVITTLIPLLETSSLTFIALDDKAYENLKVKDYLALFADLNNSSKQVDDVLKLTQLDELKKKRISTLNESEFKRMMLARAVVSETDYVFMEDPLGTVDKSTQKLIVQTLETMSQEGVGIVTSSESFRRVMLMPGNSYHLVEGGFIPIYESLEQMIGANFSQQKDLNSRLEVKTEGKTIFVPIQDIYYAESIDSVCHIYIKNSLVATQFTLEELSRKLESYNFYRSHRSYLVNLLYVTEIQQWTKNSYVISLDSLEDLTIPLSKRRYQDFLSQLHSAS